MTSYEPTTPLISLRCSGSISRAGSSSVALVMNQKRSAVVSNASPNGSVSRGPGA